MIEYIFQNMPELIELLLALVGLAAVIVKLTPSPKDDKVLAKIHNFLVLVSQISDKRYEKDNQKNKNSSTHDKTP